MTRNALAAALVGIFVMATAIYLAVSPASFPGAWSAQSTATAEVKAVMAPPFVMFRALTADAFHGRVAMVATRGSDRTRHIAPLSCLRVHYAGGTGVCVIDQAAGRTMARSVEIFDSTFTLGQRVALDGIPIRLRVSPDGRWAAITVYGEEQLAGGEERLATRTVVVEVAAARVLDLRTFPLDTADAAASRAPRDVSSVAFAGDGDRFFATLVTSSNHYVLQGSLTARTLRVIRPGLANEALSPDNRRLAVKKRGADGASWKLMVLDLATLAEQPLDHGPRSVDDQVEWLDDAHLIYHDTTDTGTGVWSLAVDGTTPPRLLIADAYSPAVAR